MNVLIDWKLFVQMEREELFILLIHALVAGGYSWYFTA